MLLCNQVYLQRGNTLNMELKSGSSLRLNLGTCPWIPITGAGSAGRAAVSAGAGQLFWPEGKRRLRGRWLEATACLGCLANKMVPAICLSDAGGWF